MKLLILILAALALSGCLTWQHRENPPENLMVKCPKSLTLLTDGTGQDVVLTMRNWSTTYHDCATRHNGLVDALRGEP